MQYKTLGLAIGLALGVVSGAGAQESPIKFSGSGFLTVAAGKILGDGDKRDVVGWNCPCFVSDYAQGGIYEDKGWTIKPDSKLGLQGKVQFGKDFSVTGQVVSRGAKDGDVNVEWVYASYDINPNLTIQAGRKRLPLLYYSESQDVGVTYPWAHLPPQVYGWEIVNYNGANLLYRDQFGSWSTTLNVFGGKETAKDNGYWKVYNGKNSETNSRWDSITGAELVLSRDWFEGRVGYIKSYYQNQTVIDASGAAVVEDATAGTSPEWSAKGSKQTIYSVSANVDFDNLIMRAEYLFMKRPGYNETDTSKMFGIGYRIGKFLPMVSVADYQFGLPDGYVDGTETVEGHRVTSLVLRYDLTASSALKAQYDYWRDHSDANYRSGFPYGNSKMISLAYDLVF